MSNRINTLTIYISNYDFKNELNSNRTIELPPQGSSAEAYLQALRGAMGKGAFFFATKGGKVGVVRLNWLERKCKWIRPLFGHKSVNFSKSEINTIAEACKKALTQKREPDVKYIVNDSTRLRQKYYSRIGIHNHKHNHPK